ncbi:MAG: GWxTD domain-containing protein [Bacteroidales bacterium]|nr:GWxTD domain-containing protein [Bacteroidales bacterium]
MKKILVLLLLSLPYILSAQGLNAIYSFYTFSSQAGNYVELCTSIDLNSVVYNQGTAEVELTTLICNAENTEEIVYVDKRNIKSTSTQSNNQMMMDIQRAKLNNGNYVLYLSFKDKNSTQLALETRDVIRMNYPEKELSLSDIQIINPPVKSDKQAANVKNGYVIEPYMFDVISKDNNILNYYVEIYNADKYFGKDSLYALTAVIENFSTNRKVEGIMRAERMKAKEQAVIIGNIDLSDLEEGSYYLTIEVRDANNILHAYKKETFFKESDKKSSLDQLGLPADAFVFQLTDEQLNENIEILHPVATEEIKKFIENDLSTASKEVKLYFLYSYWQTKNPNNPQKEWQDYRNRLDFVNRKYSTNIKKGYETDMGRIYLVYGPPSNIIDEKFKGSSGFRKRTQADYEATPELERDDPEGVTYLPYQMWRYDHTPFGESNRTFVFYAPQNDMAEYFLLHSNVRGEKQDMYWESVLSRYTLPEGVEGDAGVQFRKGHL